MAKKMEICSYPKVEHRRLSKINGPGNWCNTRDLPSLVRRETNTSHPFKNSLPLDHLCMGFLYPSRTVALHSPLPRVCLHSTSGPGHLLSSSLTLAVLIIQHMDCSVIWLASINSYWNLLNQNHQTMHLSGHFKMAARSGLWMRQGGGLGRLLMNFINHYCTDIYIQYKDTH